MIYILHTNVIRSVKPRVNNFVCQSSTSAHADYFELVYLSTSTRCMHIIFNVLVYYAAE